MAREPVNIAYNKQSISGAERVNILKYAKEKNIGNVMFAEETSDIKNWKERKIGKIINSLKSGDRLIIPGVTGLGRSTIEVLDILKTAVEKSVLIFSVKGDLELNDDSLDPETMIAMFSVFSELEKEFISIRTKVALEARKLAGVKLGRPKGPGKSKLDKNKDEIIALLKNGSTKAYIAKKFKTTTPNLYNWLKKNKVNVKPAF